MRGEVNGSLALDRFCDVYLRAISRLASIAEQIEPALERRGS